MPALLHLPFNAHPSSAALCSEKGPGGLCAGGGLLAQADNSHKGTTALAPPVVYSHNGLLHRNEKE